VENLSLIRNLILVWFLSGAVYGFGQAVNFATLQGRVTDATGAVIPGVSVQATQVATGLVRSTITNEEGNYLLPNMPVGPYELRVSIAGFRDYVRKGIVLSVGEAPAINAVLEVGGATETVEVSASVALVETRENSISTLMDNSRIVELPLNGRNLPDLIMLSGGASNASLPSQDLNSSKNYGNGTSGASQTISVYGGQQNGNNYLLDGGDNNDAFSNVNAPFPFPDAVQEFSIQTTGLTARYGVHPGATVNAITKSGTNDFHGSVFEFLRNPVVNAHHVQFVPPKPGALDDTIKRNQWGGTFGGPLVRDKLMFFAGYQATRQRSTPSPSTAIVPTAAVLGGDFSTILSNACLGAGRGKTLASSFGFNGNKIDPGKFNPQAVALLKSVPVATDPCGTISYTVPTTVNEDQGVTRLDWNINSKQTLFARYFATDYRGPVGFDPANILPQSTASQFSRFQSVAVSDTYTLNPRLVNSLHVTGTRLGISRGANGRMITPSAVGINVPSPVSSGMVLSVSSYFSIGGGSAMPGHFNNNLFQVADDVDWVHGRHELSFGVNWMRMQLNYLSTFQSNGQFTFGGNVTGDNLADFLLGQVSTFVQGNPEAENWRYTYLGFYAHDNVKLLPNLTLNAGVRWEPYFPSIDAMHRGSHFDYNAFAAGTHSKVFPNAPAGLFYCGDAGIPCSFANNRMLQFSPRAGLIWDPRGSGKETIRATYGLFYDSPEMYYFDRYADNSPYGSGISFTPTSAGGLTNPYQGQTVPAFPLPFPKAQDPNAFFPLNGVYINNDLNVHPTYVQNWNLSVEKQIASDWLLSASYVGSKTTHVWVAYEANPGLPVNVPANAIGTCTAGQAPATSNVNCRRALYIANPDQGQYFSNLTTLWDGANAEYNALLLTARHRFADNFTLLGNYTFSHCVSDQDFTGELTNSRPTLYSSPVTAPAVGALKNDRGNCSFDVRQNFNTSLVLSSPKTSGGVKGMLLNNWQLAPLLTYRTGLFFTVLTGADTALQGTTTSFKDRPNQIGDPNQGTCSNGAAVGTTSCWFNTTAFVAPASGAYGNVRRNSINGPNAFTFDAAISRKFPVKERTEVQLRLDAFNVLNHPNLSIPTASVNNSNFGKILSQNGDGRTFQAALKFVF
jgi:hypothetical protein